MSKLRSAVAIVGVCTVLAPVFVAYGLFRFAEVLTSAADRMRSWVWMQKCVDVSDRIAAWESKWD